MSKFMPDGVKVATDTPPISRSHVGCTEPCCVRFEDHPTAEFVAQAERERFMIFSFFHADEAPEHVQWAGAAVRDWWLQKHGIPASNNVLVQMVVPPLTMEQAKAAVMHWLKTGEEDYKPVSDA